ncbi:hypothetical protein NFI96_007890 [Prochilodus magdalenae]|nr:hypothetical protein NFI96_007890 [Prochilodus magdalenae]
MEHADLHCTARVDEGPDEHYERGWFKDSCNLLPGRTVECSGVKTSYLTSKAKFMFSFPCSFTIAILDDRALQHLAAELARLDRQITALLKKQKELLQMKSQLEASMGVSRWSASSSAALEVSPSVLAPARPQHMPGHTIFTPVPQGVWKRQRRRGPTRLSPPPQPSFAHDNQFSALSSPPTPTPASRPPSPAPAPRASSQDAVCYW